MKLPPREVTSIWFTLETTTDEEDKLKTSFGLTQKKLSCQLARYLLQAKDNNEICVLKKAWHYILLLIR